MWQQTSSVASANTVQDQPYGAVKSEVGAASMALGWLGLIFMMISAVGLLVMIISISLLDRLINE